jgi:uncharacterized membrane protein YjdF
MTPAAFTAAYVAAFTAFSAARGDRRIVAYLVVVAIVGGGVRLAHRAAPFSPALRWAVAGCGLLHLIGGLAPSPTKGAPVFYETWLVPAVLKYDQVVHFAISAVLTVVAWQVLRLWLDLNRAGPVVHAALAVVVANAFGALNEAFEFLSALRFADAFVGGLSNAGWDLVFNGFGAATAAVLLITSRDAHAPIPAAAGAMLGGCD